MRSTGMRQFNNWAGPAVFAAYLFAGNIKGDPRLASLPIDLTVLLAVGSIATALLNLFRKDFTFPREFKTILLMYLVFALPAVWTSWSYYGEEKASRFFTLTLLSSALPFFLLQSRTQLKRFADVLTGLSILMALDSIVTIAGNFGDWKEGARLTATGADTIALGRALGFSSIWVLVNNYQKTGIRLVVALSSAALLMALMFATGSRGPLLAFAITLIAVIVTSRFRATTLWLRVGLVLGSCVLAIWLGLLVAPSASTDRIAAGFQGNPLSDTRENISIFSRAEAIRISIETIAANPMGTGWGALKDYLRQHNDDIAYPHNLLLEVFGELGWISGALLLFVVGSALFKSGVVSTKTRDPLLQAVFSVLVFFFINSLVSGDLNDNRLLFAFLSVAMFMEGVPLQGDGLTLPPDELAGEELDYRFHDQVSSLEDSSAQIDDNSSDT